MLKGVQIYSIFLCSPAAAVTTTIVDEFVVHPKDFEVLFPTFPPHMAVEFGPREEIGFERPLNLAVDRDVVEAKIIVFGLAMSFECVVCAEPIDDMNLTPIHDGIGDG
ncbi:hypothetical protein PTKIN_Ptkin15bG0131200 [Pterospermum kingtungense]